MACAAGGLENQRCDAPQVLPSAEPAVLRAYAAAGVRAATIGTVTPAKRVLIKCQVRPRLG